MGTIHPDHNLHFIREKIYGLQTAIMYSMSNNIIKIPNNIINVLKVDDDGALWFHCNVPFRHLENYERSFPVRLLFFKKGSGYHMEVSGPAVIISAENDQASSTGESKCLLLRMNIYSAEYAEPQLKEKSRLDHFMERIFNWLANTIAFPQHEKPLFLKIQKNN